MFNVSKPIWERCSHRTSEFEPVWEESLHSAEKHNRRIVKKRNSSRIVKPSRRFYSMSKRCALSEFMLF
jgi:hypothetical protein